MLYDKSYHYCSKLDHDSMIGADQWIKRDASRLVLFNDPRLSSRSDQNPLVMIYIYILSKR